jgi:hypothetical protein
MQLLELYVVFCQYGNNGNPGKNYITDKKITLPKMISKIFHTDTVRGVTGNVNLSVR